MFYAGMRFFCAQCTPRARYYSPCFYDYLLRFAILHEDALATVAAPPPLTLLLPPPPDTPTCSAMLNRVRVYSGCRMRAAIGIQRLQFFARAFLAPKAADLQ